MTTAHHMDASLVDFLDLDDRSRTMWQELYESSFPVELRASMTDLFAGRVDERQQALVDGDGDVLAISVVRDLGDTGWSFLRYLAVDGGRRGSGLGTQMWRSLTGDLLDRGQVGLALDVEDPDEVNLEPEEAQERRARVRFYARLGAELAPISGYAPPEHGQVGDSPPPLRLVVAPLAVWGGTTPVALDDAGLAGVVTAVLTLRYGVATGDPSLVACLRRSGLPVAVEGFSGRGKQHL